MARMMAGSKRVALEARMGGGEGMMVMEDDGRDGFGGVGADVGFGGGVGGVESLGFQSGAKAKRIDMATVEARTLEELMSGARRLSEAQRGGAVSARDVQMAMGAGGGPHLVSGGGAGHPGGVVHACATRAHGACVEGCVWDETLGIGYEDIGACSHCGRDLCEMCWRSCETCQDVFCDGCSVLNYDASVDRTFCLDCNDEYCREKVRSPGAKSHHGHHARLV